MFTFRKSLVVVAAFAACLATVSPAAASPYPEPLDVTIDLDVRECAVGGTDVTIEAHAQSGEEDLAGTMTIEAFGETYTENDNDFSKTVESPVVTEDEDFTIEATFVPDDSSFRTATATETITLAPRSDGCEDEDDDGDEDGDEDGDGDGDGDGGILPDTGGVNLLYLVLGAILLALGAAVLELQRRRKNAV